MAGTTGCSASAAVAVARGSAASRAKAILAHSDVMTSALLPVTEVCDSPTDVLFASGAEERETDAETAAAAGHASLLPGSDTWRAVGLTRRTLSGRSTASTACTARRPGVERAAVEGEDELSEGRAAEVSDTGGDASCGTTVRAGDVTRGT